MQYANAYQSTAAHGRVASADPHGLTLLLMSGAVERMAKVRGCIQNKATVEKAELVHRVVAIIDELRGTLNIEAGGEMARNLDNLYDYISRRLLLASLRNDLKPLDEALKLMQGIRDAWQSIPPQFRHAKTGTKP